MGTHEQKRAIRRVLFGALKELIILMRVNKKATFFTEAAFFITEEAEKL
jgi:hypothetical protein